MKSKNLLLINGIIAIIGFFVIGHSSSDRGEFTIFYLASRSVEVSNWGTIVNMTCFIY